MLSPEQAAKILADAGYSSAQIAAMDGREFDRLVKRLNSSARKAPKPKTLPALRPNFVTVENQDQFQDWLREAPAGARHVYFQGELDVFRDIAPMRIAQLQRREDKATLGAPRPATEAMELTRLQTTLALCRQVLAAYEMGLVHLNQGRPPVGKGRLYYVTKKPRPVVAYADTAKPRRPTVLNPVLQNKKEKIWRQAILSVLREPEFAQSFTTLEAITFIGNTEANSVPTALIDIHIPGRPTQLWREHLSMLELGNVDAEAMVNPDAPWRQAMRARARKMGITLRRRNAMSVRNQAAVRNGFVEG